jgi:SAM-dependent methyltransferase
MGWGDGYMTETEYVSHFHAEQSPAYLNFSCVLHGIEPVALDREFTYFELGFGQGVTANVLAASNPQGRFYAADFNPAHVVAAQQLASDAQLDNLTLLEHSFAELAAGHANLPQFDFITMHGVYSWVGPDARRDIVAFVLRYLKPGGILYLTYNAMPGWAASLPLQRLVYEHVMYPGSVESRLKQAGALVDQLAAVNAKYLTENPDPTLAGHIESLRNAKAGYLAHEHMNAGWNALYHADVARDLADAKLDYACSAVPLLAFPQHWFTQEQQGLIATVPDARLCETVKDMLCGTRMRKDIFVRGARRMSPQRQMQWLQKTGVALTVPRETAQAKVQLPSGGHADVRLCAAVLDALADGPQSLAALAGLPEFSATGITGVAEIAAILVASRQLSPYFLHAANANRDAAHRFNRIAAQRVADGEAPLPMAMPLLGSGLRTTGLPWLVYRVLCRNHGALPANAVVAEIRAFLARRSGGAADGTADQLSPAVENILVCFTPIWQQLNALPNDDPLLTCLRNPPAIPPVSAAA